MVMAVAVLAGGLVKRFGAVEALRGLSFAARKGELVVLAGPNGAGKTTAIRILTTNLKPDTGRAEVLGFEVVREYREVRRRIYYVPQDYGAHWDLTPSEYVVSVLMSRGVPYHEARRRAREWLEVLGLSQANRPLRQLSGGQVRRAIVAVALASEAEVLFLDEPTSGIDVEARREVWRALRERVRSGACIILTTHDMGEAEAIADRVVIVRGGRALYEGPPRDLVSKVPFAYRAVVRKPAPPALDHAVDLGDRLIVYFRKRSEFDEFVGSLEDLSQLLAASSVGLEDAFILLLGGGAA
jgi:ABC-2 type transport system ATP-binding protein